MSWQIQFADYSAQILVSMGVENVVS